VLTVATSLLEKKYISTKYGQMDIEKQFMHVQIEDREYIFFLAWDYINVELTY